MPYNEERMMKVRHLAIMAFSLAAIVCFGFFVLEPAISDDDHDKYEDHGREYRHKTQHGHAGSGHEDKEREEKKSRERENESENEGSETAGLLAAWLLAAANLPVVFSVMIKAARWMMPDGASAKKSLADFNRFQKRRLMFLHYYLNPLCLCIAVYHFMSSSCRATPLPEVGLLCMIALMILGAAIKFRLCPKSLLKSVYQIHTQPFLIALVVSVLAIGHVIAD